jgi:hypothetical protein
MRSQNLKTVAHHPELALVRRVDPVAVPIELVLKQSTLAGAIALCVQLSGLEEKEVYLSLDIDAGHWTRIMKGEAHFPVNKLVAMMDLCGNEAPLIWLANARGYGLVVLKTEADRRAEHAEARAQEAEKKLAWALEVINGKRGAA